MTTQPTTNERIIGSLKAYGAKGNVHVEELYDTDIDDLWSALTDPQRLDRWLAHVEGDLRPGGSFRALFTSGWEGAGRVDVCEPPRRLVVSMSGGEGDGTVMEAQLVVVGHQTKLVIEEQGLALEELPLHGAGWQAHVEDLSAYLANRERSDWQSRWLELTPIYQERANRPAQ